MKQLSVAVCQAFRIHFFGTIYYENMAICLSKTEKLDCWQGGRHCTFLSFFQLSTHLFLPLSISCSLFPTGTLSRPCSLSPFIHSKPFFLPLYSPSPPWFSSYGGVCVVSSIRPIDQGSLLNDDACLPLD